MAYSQVLVNSVKQPARPLAYFAPSLYGNSFSSSAIDNEVCDDMYRLNVHLNVNFFYFLILLLYIYLVLLSIDIIFYLRY